MTTIITKNGSGAPTAGQLSEGELAVDLTNKELYTKSGSTVIKIGGTGGGETGTFTDLTATSSFTSPGIDDNATSTAITISSSERVGIKHTGQNNDPLRVGLADGEGVSIGTRDQDGTFYLGMKQTVSQWNNSGHLKWEQSGNVNDLTINAGGGDLKFITTNQPYNERMRITSSGNVGIGNTGSNAKLEVTATSGEVFRADAAGGAYRIVATQTGVNMAGNVGIGTTNPLNKLVVAEGTGQHGIEFSPGDLAYMTVYDRATSAYSDLKIDAKTIVLGTDNGTERMRIDSAGRIEIGNNIPVWTGAYGGALLLKGDNVTSNRYAQLGILDSNGAIIADGLIVDTSGNVGIGQNNPSAPLTVDGPSNDTYVARFGNYGGGGGLIQGRTDIGLDFWATENGTHPAAAVGVEQVSTDQYRGGLLFSTRGTNSDVAPVERVRITSSGNVGIGTTSPMEDLSIRSSSTTAGLSLAASTNQCFVRYNNYYAGSTQVSDASKGTASMGLGKSNDGVITLSTAAAGAGAPTERMRIDAAGNLLVGRTSVSAATTDHGWQAYNTGIVYQYADAATSTDVHRWYNGAGSLVASINARGEGFFLGGATYSGPLKADEIIQDGAPVVDSLQIIRAFMKLRAATADPDSTVEELREKLKTAVDDIIDQFQDQIDNMPTPLED